MRGACITCWPSDLLGPPTSPVVPNASFMPTPEQCEAASSSWGRAAPHWLTDKIARCARRQERWHGDLGSFSHHQIMPRAALSLFEPATRALAALTGHVRSCF